MNGNKAKKTLQKQYKRQNEYIKNSYDRISVTIPKGYKEIIKKEIGSINGYINELITKDFEKRGIKHDNQ